MLVITLVLISIPVFVIGYLLQFFVALKFGLFPVTATDGSWFS